MADVVSVCQNVEVKSTSEVILLDGNDNRLGTCPGWVSYSDGVTNGNVVV
jgi:hypothetical protein